MGNRKYFEIKLPKGNESLKLALDICIGKNITQRYALDESSVIIKTTGNKLDAEEKKGVRYNDIFPEEYTTKMGYKKMLKLSRSEKYQSKEP